MYVYHQYEYTMTIQFDFLRVQKIHNISSLNYTPMLRYKKTKHYTVPFPTVSERCQPKTQKRDDEGPSLHIYLHFHSEAASPGFSHVGSMTSGSLTKYINKSNAEGVADCILCTSLIDQTMEIL